jgi:hypothetical protein
MRKLRIPKTKQKDYMGFGKFKDIDYEFHHSVEEMLKLNIPTIDFIHQFPIFTGHVNIGRYLFFYDLYKQCYKLSGHIADVGSWKGASFFFMAKLVRLFEQYNTTQVHGFDWFKGMKPDNVKDDTRYEGKYSAEYRTVLKLIELQKLHDVAIMHRLNLVTELGDFFKKHPHLRFKMVFIDCGVADVLENSLRYFWPRVVPRGVLIMDHYNVETSPHESALFEKHIGDHPILQMPFNRQPTAYVMKEKTRV